MKKLRAFTLIEVAMVVTILTISITLVTAWTLNVLDQAQLQSSYESMLGILRRTHVSALGSQENLSHGIRFTLNDYTTFAGETFDVSDPDTRQTFELPPQIELSSISLNGGGSDLIFQKGSGETNQYGTVTIDHSEDSQPIILTISPLGLVY